ncbi:exopolysaccharide production repressor protein [Mesorhizobium sp. M00.F.Ca.ET.216.01.1.1]|uniref:exopolysaccharide production repressor protein n=1 Tax=Mesorhizobium sp. M00.F.Ca.ET.216.01.1.1 TaxID=2500528 RepID=UPI000FD8A7AA|nr:exopolysaccharide production repressor protein [Mesorhizobium sp. M00.F.Ca.ET.216.01.1.1]TGQ34655.1 hypothetical protein EN859_024760 [Mesorhizobium sp. M00.F.Ca.ET.216.01.1.1]TJW03120.1 MAG: hypothetical protein E5W82_33145 [Mesorhizobium sp.]TJW41598.1 MAG: hypothetical protein E5W83_25335 [Mesorhizobium sp.]
MYFPQFLVGMAAALLAIMAWVYTATGSVWQSLGWTFVAALLLQAGYFIAVLFLIYGHATSAAEADNSVPAKTPLERDGIIHALLSMLR